MRQNGGENWSKGGGEDSGGDDSGRVGPCGDDGGVDDLDGGGKEVGERWAESYDFSFFLFEFNKLKEILPKSSYMRHANG